MHKDKKQISGSQGWGQGRKGSDCLMGTRYTLGVMKMFWS